MTAPLGLLILLICLIILPVLIFSNHFSQETFATSNTEDHDSEGEGDESNNDPAPDDFEGAVDSGGGNTGDHAGQGVNSDDLAGDSNDLADGGELDSSGGFAGAVDGSDSRDLDDDDDRFRHNAEEIAMELSSLPPEEIRVYPITDLSDNDIVLVFGFLNPGNLTKVLLNIPQEDLADIRDRLTPVTFTESLSRISEVDRSQVANRLVFATTVN
jgi:hypothetical protein